MRRGHRSIHDVTTGISLSSGQVLDYEVYSKYCCACSSKQAAVSAGKMTQAVFTAQQDHDVSKSTTGSSGSVEVQGAVDLWGRSSEHRQLFYTTFIGDGDCKGHHAVVEGMPYGAECPVEKEECGGHMQKRIGGRLREPKK